MKLLPEVDVPVIIFSGESKGHSASMGAHYETQVRTYCEHYRFSQGGHMLFYIEYEGVQLFAGNVYSEDILAVWKISYTLGDHDI